MNERTLDLAQSLKDWERRNRTRMLGLVLIPLAVAGGLGWYAQDRLERAEAGRDEAVRHVVTSETKLGVTRGELTALRAVGEEGSSTIAAARAQLESEQSQRAAAEATLATARGEADTLRRDLDAARQSLAAATAQTSQAQESASAAAASLRADLETTRQALQQQAARADGLETELDGLRAQLAAAQAALAESGRQLTALRAAQQDAAGSKAAAGELEAELGRARQEIAALQATGAEMQRSLEQRDQALAALRKETDARTGSALERAAALGRERDQALAARDQVLAERDRLAGEREAAAQQAEETSARVAALETELGKAREREAALTQARSEVETQAQTADAGLHQQVASLERRLAESAKARETADQGVTALAGELDDAKQGLATREAMLATQTTALEALRAERDALQQQLAAARAEIQEAVRAAALTPLTLPERSEPAAEPAESMPAPAPPVAADRLAAVRAGLAKASGVEVLDGERLVLGSALLFPPGQAELSPEGRQGLRAIADRLKTALSTLPPGTAWTLHIDGHTDDTPVRHSRFASNQALSEARARAVTDYLASRGLPPDRLVAAGLADRQPLAAGRSEEARGRNRRIELRLTTP